MPFPPGDVHWERLCAPGPDGRWRAWVTVSVSARALWRLGLHPRQPTAGPAGVPPPRWWHAAGERYAAGAGRWNGG
ncbi:hypothetical protein ABT033_15295 [Streptomyces pharetrae]|uniref:hypothetical protein n=1 Tax=Streptomyces pharetrae TaxID=291370 RepID=UPI00335DCF2E